ncbi:Tetratricopeptide repeat-containing protein [Reichenbachiella faecimaris]|uniref:histidine kinase n=1 Tax=Reichenbachiella faecimaris TaxID=692418 RepID=A0A1W2GQX4_REIFA|nr:ATP-binding protein [Reichenbachiella faecimaris]SMD39039.1 Tetratricopeptide repeat-containing protein [Reichenbachiella faecimaris]
MRISAVIITLLVMSLNMTAIAQQASYNEAVSLLEKTKYNQKRGNLEGAIGHALLGLDQAETLGNQELIIQFKEVIGGIYLAKKDYKNAVSSYFAIVLAAERQDDQEGLGMGNLALANTFSDMGAYDKASDYYQRTIDNFETLGKKREKANAIQALGYNYSNSNQFSKSILTFESLLKLAISESLYSYISSAQKQLFLDNIKTNNATEAAKYGLSYYERIKDKGNSATLSDATRNLALQFIKIGDNKNALKFANISVNIDGQNTMSLETLAKAYAANENYNKAIENFEKALESNDRKRNSEGMARNYNQMAELAIDRGDLRVASNNLGKAEEIGIERNTRITLLDTYRMLALVNQEKGNEDQEAKYRSMHEAVKLQIGDPDKIVSKLSRAKENLAESYEQEARATISTVENKKLAQEREKLRAQQKLKDIEIIEQQARLQAQELQKKKLEAERAKQELLITEKTNEASTREAELERLQLDAELQKLSEEERDKRLELIEKEREILRQQTELQAQKIESDRQARMLYFMAIGATVIILAILMVAFYRTYNNSKTIREQNQNLAEQQKTILNRNIQLKKSSEAMLAMNNKLKKAHVNLKVLLKKEQATKEQLEKTNLDLKNTQVHLVQAEKMSSLGLLTAGIAHEINNPINFVSSGVQSLTKNFGEIESFLENYQKVLALDNLEEIKKYATVLQEDEDFLNELQDSSKELLEDVRYGILRITEIVNGLRSFSRHDEAEVKETDLNESFDSALLILKNKYKNKTEIIKEMDETLPQIQCFPGQLNQVFVNLINNAIDAIDENGEIKIRTINLDDSSIEIRISDNGTGMPEDVKAKIFDPFFTTKEIGKGTGLGLSISHGIIEKHRGTIRVESKMGVGTTFIINLPKKLELDDKILEEQNLKLG